MSDPRSLSVEQRFHDELVALPTSAQRQVARVLRDIRRDPFHDAKRVSTYRTIWRRRAGAYRILFTPTDRSIHVHSVQPRRSVYQRAIPEVEPPAVVPPHEVLQNVLEETTPTTGQVVTQALGLEQYQLGEELMDAISQCETTEDFADLISLGVPDYIFDLLWYEFERRGAMPQVSTSWTVRLLTRGIIDEFFEGVFGLRASSPIAELSIVAPWITAWTGSRSSLDALERFIRERRLRVHVITRPPTMGSHREAIRRLNALPMVRIFFLQDLHAKFMICDVAPIPFALIGSANVTTRSLQRNYELGVMVRGAGEAETVIRELESLRVELQAISTYKEQE